MSRRTAPAIAVTFLSVTQAHVMPTFARTRVARTRVARNNCCIPKRDGYIHTNYLQDATRNYLPRAKALGNYICFTRFDISMACIIMYCQD